MGKALQVIQGGLKLGTSIFGKHGNKAGSVNQIVHDGDTMSVLLDGGFGVRFLGIDTPEVSFQLPGSDSFIGLGNDKWNKFFTTGNWKKDLDVGSALMKYLQKLIGEGAGVAKNHADLSKKAQESLESIVAGDVKLSGKTNDEFRFFMAFGLDFLDTYGRLLCYLNSDRSNFANQANANQSSYNERQLASGWAMPYFIWPNIQPFISIRPFEENNVRPKDFWKIVTKSKKLQTARKNVAQARKDKKGIFDKDKPLVLQPFELRFISRKKGPDRYVIDLGDEGGKTILKPEAYIKIKNLEDRLYVPKEFIPVFERFGWKVK